MVQPLGTKKTTSALCKPTKKRLTEAITVASNTPANVSNMTRLNISAKSPTGALPQNVFARIQSLPLLSALVQSDKQSFPGLSSPKSLPTPLLYKSQIVSAQPSQ